MIILGVGLVRVLRSGRTKKSPYPIPIGEELAIYENGAYQGDIGDAETDSITEVLFRNYNLEAVDKNSNTVVQ